MRVLNPGKQTCLGDRIEVADGVWSRFVGLLGRRSLAAGGGLLILPSSGVHTLGMLFPIDVLFLDQQRRVVAYCQNLKPFRVTSLHWNARSVLELPEGTIRATRTDVGDQLAFE